LLYVSVFILTILYFSFPGLSHQPVNWLKP